MGSTCGLVGRWPGAQGNGSPRTEVSLGMTSAHCPGLQACVCWGSGGADWEAEVQAERHRQPLD